MFIDYITLTLINMVAGLFILAHYVYKGLDSPNQKLWVPGFGVTGAIALTTDSASHKIGITYFSNRRRKR
jgi:putative membrane protein